MQACLPSFLVPEAITQSHRCETSQMKRYASSKSCWFRLNFSPTTSEIIDFFDNYPLHANFTAVAALHIVKTILSVVIKGRIKVFVLQAGIVLSLGSHTWVCSFRDIHVLLYYLEVQECTKPDLKTWRTWVISRLGYELERARFARGKHVISSRASSSHAAGPSLFQVFR